MPLQDCFAGANPMVLLFLLASGCSPNVSPNRQSSSETSEKQSPASAPSGCKTMSPRKNFTKPMHEEFLSRHMEHRNHQTSDELLRLARVGHNAHINVGPVLIWGQESCGSQPEITALRYMDVNPRDKSDDDPLWYRSFLLLSAQPGAGWALFECTLKALHERHRSSGRFCGVFFISTDETLGWWDQRCQQFKNRPGWRCEDWMGGAFAFSLDEPRCRNAGLNPNHWPTLDDVVAGRESIWRR